MKRTIVTGILSFVAGAMLFASPSRVPVARQVEAQSANPRSDLVTGIRLDVVNLNAAMDSFLAHRAEYTGKNITFVSGDLVGANATAGFTAADVNQAFTDFNTIVTDVRSGGTIAVGVWTNCLKLK